MNIENYVFSDLGSELICDSVEDGEIEMFAPYDYFNLNKQDVIALAKHFKLTSKDIEDK